MIRWLFRDMSTIEIICKSYNIKFYNVAIRRMKTANMTKIAKIFKEAIIRVHKGRDY